MAQNLTSRITERTESDGGSLATIQRNYYPSLEGAGGTINGTTALIFLGAAQTRARERTLMTR
jgi:hypothetical protein